MTKTKEMAKKRTASSTVIQMSPVGWWLSYKEDQCVGPFKTSEEAEEEAKYLVPMAYSEYHLLHVVPWERRTVKNASHSSLYDPCPNCKGTGFVGGSCCRKCEGTMRVPRIGENHDES